MIIRKLFKFAGAHMVRNADTKRCSQSLHGHNYFVEVFLSGDGLNQAGMIIDFGLFKPYVGEFIDSFDHAYSLWSKENDEVKNNIKTLSKRWIEMPVSPSAENYALMFLYVIDKIIDNMEFANGEQSPYVYSVRVHETETGYAEAFAHDLYWFEHSLEDIHFSDQVSSEWKNQNWWNELINRKKWILETPEQQCKLD